MKSEKLSRVIKGVTNKRQNRLWQQLSICQEDERTNGQWVKQYKPYGACNPPNGSISGLEWIGIEVLHVSMSKELTLRWSRLCSTSPLDICCVSYSVSCRLDQRR